MKWMVASDIHGSAYFCQKLLECFAQEKPDRLLLLGDILYHGPRNALPRDYDPKAVIAMLNAKKQDIYCIRGNCDTEVDQMVLEFPILADYCILDAGNAMIYATHGHVYSENKPPLLHDGDILLCGHTHVPKCTTHKTCEAKSQPAADYIYMNPGSVSIPKEDSWHGYMTIENGLFFWKDLAGCLKLQYKLERDAS